MILYFASNAEELFQCIKLRLTHSKDKDSSLFLSSDLCNNSCFEDELKNMKIFEHINQMKKSTKDNKCLILSEEDIIKDNYIEFTIEQLPDNIDYAILSTSNLPLYQCVSNRKIRCLDFQDDKLKQYSLSMLSEKNKANLYQLFQLNQLSICENSLIILPPHYRDMNDSVHYKEIYMAILDLCFPNKQVYVKKTDGDILGLYRKWLGEIHYINSSIPNELLVNYLAKASIKLLNFSKKDKEYKYINNCFTLNTTDLTINKIYIYYIIINMVKKYNKNYQLFAFGTDSLLIDLLTDRKVDFSDDIKDILSKPSIIIIDDNVDEDQWKEVLWSIYKDELNFDTIIIFMNNKNRYLFYQPGYSQIIEAVIPYGIENKQGDLKMNNYDESVFYIYTKNDDMRKQLLTSKVDIALKKSGLELSNVNDIEVAFLRGMLEATELRVLQLKEKLSMLKE